MKIIVGSDHRGVQLKAPVLALLSSLGHEVTDIGADQADKRVDYTDYAFGVADGVAAGAFERGVLICSSGIGMSVAANRVRGVRAALCRTLDDARLSRSHNDANVLCLGQSVTSVEDALAIVRLWLAGPFEGGRHQARVDKLDAHG